MRNPASLWRGLARTAAVAVWAALVLPHARAVSSEPSPPLKTRDPDLLQALKFEEKGLWADACKAYDQVLRKDRSRADVRRHYQDCYRHWQQVRRHLDPTYRREVLPLPYSQALHLYRVLLTSLHARHVDPDQAEPRRLFQRGLEEFHFALTHGVLTPYVRGFAGKPAEARKQAVKTFADNLYRYADRPVRSAEDAERLVREIAMTAQRPPALGGLGLDATPAVLEFACGACTALDEFTFYLTPGQFRALTAAAKGTKVIGVGLELAGKDNNLVVSKVWPGSPADRKGLKVEDLVTRIGKRLTDGLAPEEAMELLKGDVGTAVEVEVISDGMAKPVLLRRQELTPRSVDFGMLWQQKDGMSMATEKTDIGYVQILNFQDSTPQELDRALLYLKADGMKSLIIDLRGNRGGTFKAAVECAKRFLSSGVIVISQQQNHRLVNHLVRNGPAVAPVLVPLVVLVDGQTASAAEVLAGALKDNDRAKLVGQTTFGKGCSQKLLLLKAGRGPVGGLRVTVARFLSPTGQPYSGAGITPDVFADRQDSAGEDNQLLQARKLLQPDEKMMGN